MSQKPYGARGEVCVRGYNPSFLTHSGLTTHTHRPASRQAAIVAHLSPLVKLQGASAVLADSAGFAIREQAGALLCMHSRPTLPTTTHTR